MSFFPLWFYAPLSLYVTNNFRHRLTRVLLENILLVNLIGNSIRDRSGVLFNILASEDTALRHFLL